MARVETSHRAFPADLQRGAVPKQVLRMRMCFALAFLDLFAIALGFLAASRMPLSRTFHGEAPVQLAILMPVFLLIALFTRAYSPMLINNCWASVGRGLRAMLIAAAATVLVAFFLKIGATWSRLIFISCVGLSGIFVMVLRYAFGRHARSLIGGEPYEVLFLYDGPPGGLPEHGAIPITSIAGDAFDRSSLSPAVYDRFAAAIEHADRVVLHCPSERRQYWVQALKGADVQGELVTPEFAELNPLGTGLHAGLPTMVVTRGPLGIKDRLLKRAFDLAVSGIILLVLSPLMLGIALIIRLQDGGPALFSQMRVGRSNRQFKILKFRSMHVTSADANGDLSASRVDDRVTPIGRFIRATSIDELPQLVNVLKGDMSLVGPRPHALGSTAENQLFWHIDDRYWHRHAIRPGLTGLAQVRGYRGATNSREDLINRLQSDLEYQRHWTIWRDFMILIRTIGVLFHKNAY